MPQETEMTTMTPRLPDGMRDEIAALLVHAAEHGMTTCPVPAEYWRHIVPPGVRGLSADDGQRQREQPEAIIPTPAIPTALIPVSRQHIVNRDVRMLNVAWDALMEALLQQTHPLTDDITVELTASAEATYISIYGWTTSCFQNNEVCFRVQALRPVLTQTTPPVAGAAVPALSPV